MARSYQGRHPARRCHFHTHMFAQAMRSPVERGSATSRLRTAEGGGSCTRRAARGAARRRVVAAGEELSVEPVPRHTARHARPQKCEVYARSCSSRAVSLRSHREHPSALSCDGWAKPVLLPLRATASRRAVDLRRVRRSGFGSPLPGTWTGARAKEREVRWKLARISDFRPARDHAEPGADPTCPGATSHRCDGFRALRGWRQAGVPDCGRERRWPAAVRTSVPLDRGRGPFD